MRKILLPSLALAVLTFSCAKEAKVSEPVLPESRGTTVNLSVGDEVKSSYVPGTGVAIDGSENLAVFYSDPTSKLLGPSLKATPSGNGKYSFTIPYGAAFEETFYAVLPWTPMACAADFERTASAPIFPVQHPSATSFDPLYDVLAAEGFTISGNEGEISRFRRMTAPLRLEVKGLPAGSKIRTASVSISQKPSVQTCKGLTGIARMYMTDNYRKSALTSLEDAGFGVSAVYPEGLVSDGGGTWNVWFSVNPTGLEAGADFTVSVSTDTATFTKTAPIPVAAEIKRNELSSIAVDMTGASIEQSVTFNLNDPAVLSTISASNEATLTGSDGKSYKLSFSKTGCSAAAADGMPGGIIITSASGTGRYLTLPKPEGKDVTSARLFTRTTSTRDTSRTLNLSAYKKENAIATSSYAGFCCSSAGFCELSIPSVGTTTLGGLQLRTSDGTFSFSTMTLTLRDKFIPSYDPNDYSSIWAAGLDFEAGGRTINIDDYPNAEVIDLANLEASSFASVGIIFIDGTATPSKTISSTINPAKDLIIIGRYKNSQPKIVVDGKYIQPQSNVFKNLNIESSGSGVFTSNNGENGVCSFVVEDCTITATTGTLLREASASTRFGDVSILNSVVMMKTGVFGSASAAASVTGSEDSFTLENSVFMPLPASGSITNFKTNIFTLTSNDSKTIYRLKNNTFIGFNGPSGGAALVNSKTIGGFEIEANVFDGLWTSGKTNRVLKTTAPQSFKPEPRIIRSNFAAKNGSTALGSTNGDSQYFWNGNPKGTGTQLSLTEGDNIYTSADSPFTSKEFTNGWFPINSSVVTNGAGASYETKLWRKWGE